MKGNLVLISLVFPVVAFAQGPHGSGTYYQKAQGKKGAELKTALCGIIYNRKERGGADAAYKQLWTDFTLATRCSSVNGIWAR